MQFEDELYKAMCETYPQTTVRSISKRMGMSDGYWSSISSQGLQVSNVALMKLSDHLEVCSVQLNAGSHRFRQVKVIQKMIASELVSRFVKQVESIDQVWAEISSLAPIEHETISDSYGAMPFVMLCS
mgnify:CR=1 FL=1|jgi:hypothetical protein